MEQGAVRKRRVESQSPSGSSSQEAAVAARRPETAVAARQPEIAVVARRPETSVMARNPEAAATVRRPEDVAAAAMAARRPDETVTADDQVVVVRRRERDNGDRLRRGSLKSRIFQFKKRKKEVTAPGEPIGGGGGVQGGSPGEPCKKRREPAVILADQAPAATIAGEEGSERALLGQNGSGGGLLQLAGHGGQQEGQMAHNGHHHHIHQHHPHHHHHHFHQQGYLPDGEVAYPRYRLANGSHPASNGSHASSNGVQPAPGGPTGPFVGQAGRPTALHILPSPGPGDIGQRGCGPSSACSLASPSPPSRGLATPSLGPGTPTPSTSRCPATPTSSPLSREVEVVLRRRASQPPSQSIPQVQIIKN